METTFGQPAKLTGGAVVSAQNEDEIVLCILDQRWQGEKLLEELIGAGIQARLLKAPREYASFVTGMDADRVEIRLPKSQRSQADLVMNGFFQKAPMISVVNEESTAILPNYFRRTIILSLLGVVFLPVVFNVFALGPYQKMKMQNLTYGQRLCGVGFFWICWILALAEIYWIFQKR